jgi:hypothetical protein
MPSLKVMLKTGLIALVAVSAATRVPAVRKVVFNESV